MERRPSVWVTVTVILVLYVRRLPMAVQQAASIDAQRTRESESDGQAADLLN